MHGPTCGAVTASGDSKIVYDQTWASGPTLRTCEETRMTVAVTADPVSSTSWAACSAKQDTFLHEHPSSSGHVSTEAEEDQRRSPRVRDRRTAPGRGGSCPSRYAPKRPSDRVPLRVPSIRELVRDHEDVQTACWRIVTDALVGLPCDDHRGRARERYGVHSRLGIAAGAH